MALEHVLDTARKLGIPVVITDDRGEAAQVIMPFDDFAAMVGATSPVSGKPRITRSPKPAARGPVTIPIREEADEIVQALNELDIEAIDESLASPAPSMESTTEGSKEEGFLEDKFYLEPLNDEEGQK
jgi:hypothetical protein